MLGIFDSGLGGLTVVRAIEQRVPRAAYVYLGDTARLPYGTKSPATISRYALQALRFLKKAGATTPVVACHTVSSVLATNPSLRRRCADIFGAPELLEVVTPAITAAKTATKQGRIGILGTSATIRSRVYEDSLRGFHVVSQAASVLVPLAEEGWGRAASSGKGRALREVLREVLQPFRDENVDTVVLACTHFPILASAIRDILKPSVRLIDPGVELARAIQKADLDAKVGAKKFFATDIPGDFGVRASRFLGRSIRAKPAML